MYLTKSVLYVKYLLRKTLMTKVQIDICIGICIRFSGDCMLEIDL